MIKRLIWVFALLVLFPRGADAVRANVDRYEIQDGLIYADVSIDALSPEFLQAVRDGMEKRIEFQIELFRVWNLWMDEFVDGVEVIRSVKYDLLKNEYTLDGSGPGGIQHSVGGDEKTALGFLTHVNHVPVIPLSETQRGTFYVRVRAQSRVRELPPVVGGLLFFVPEIEFHAEGRSPRFPLHK